MTDNSNTLSLSPAEKNTLLLWGIVGILLAVASLYFPGNSVVFNYQAGAERWLRNQDLYAGPEGYLYLPQFAMLFSLLPAKLALAEIGWNWFQLSVMVSGLFYFSRLLNTGEEKSFFPLLSLAVLIIGWTTFRNGQATILQLGLMLWSIVLLENQRWMLTAATLIAGLISKPVFIVFFLVVIFFYRNLWWRLLLFGGCAFLVTVIIKGVDYTLAQHLGFITMVQQALSYGEGHEKTNWAHFFAIFPQVAGIWVPHKIQLITRLLFAVLVLVAVGIARKRRSSAMAGYYLFALSGCYLMLFNPRTETNSFVLVAPAIGYWVAISKHRFQDKAYHAFCWLFVISFPFAKYVRLITPGMWAWGKPMITVFFTIFLVKQLFSKEDLKE